jgi:hypothetical protein
LPDFFFYGRGSAGKLRVIGSCKQRGSGGDNALSALCQLQSRDGRRDRLVGDPVERLADGIEGIAANHRGDHRKAADRYERQEQLPQAIADAYMLRCIRDHQLMSH